MIIKRILLEASKRAGRLMDIFFIALMAGSGFALGAVIVIGLLATISGGGQ